MQAIQAAELNRRFGIPNIAEVVEGEGGLPKVLIKTPQASGEMYLHGAHVTSWIPADAHEVLFMSRNAVFQESKAIRGGVPICFPWFGPNTSIANAPAHGFARTRSWHLQSLEQNGGAISVTMSLTSDDKTKRWWPADFQLSYRATFDQQLSLELSLTNNGSAPLFYEAALHTYYRIGDISKAAVTGLDGIHYFDKTDSNEEKIQHGQLTFSAETDRVYVDTMGDIQVVDPVLRRRITVSKHNSQTTVVWNPWWEKAKALDDLGETAWPNMVCVEACNVAPFVVELAPGQHHSMKSVTRLSAL